MKYYFFFFSVFVIGLAVGYGYGRLISSSNVDMVVSIENFVDCVAAGNVIMESFSRQCRSANGRLFVEDVGNELEKRDLIFIDSPRSDQMIHSPLRASGEARGSWFFEATFPVVLTDWDGRIIAEHYAEAKESWMTEEFVRFESTLEFESPVFSDADDEHFSRRGLLILRKSNASGIPEYNDALEIPVRF